MVQQDNPWQQALQPLRSEMSVEQTLLVVGDAAEFSKYAKASDFAG